MIAVAYRRTMASAKFPKPEPAEPVQEQAKEPAVDWKAARDELEALRRQRIEEQKREVAVMMERARRASERYRAEEMAEIANVTLRYRPTYSEIERRICRVMHVTPNEIRSERRHRHLVFARQAVMYWCARLTLRSLPEIGRMMGGRDHTTCIAGKRAYVKKRAQMGRTLREAR